MAQRSVANSAELARRIKQRRTELNLTIEEAASKAGVGTKTWSRYEAGESIRKDKIKGICKTLNWHTLSEQENGDVKFHFEEYRQHDAYSTYLESAVNPLAAVSFAIGSDILLDYLKEDLEALSSRPKNSHIGELPASFLCPILPPQFLMNYNYEFLYLLLFRVLYFRNIAHRGEQIVAHSVIDELTLFLIMEESRFLMKSMDFKDTEFQDQSDEWDGWAYFIFEDDDLLILFSDCYIDDSNSYHFSNWTKEQFWTE